MDQESISAVVSEIKPLLIGRAPGKIFQLSPLSMAIDFGLRETGFLLLSVEPSLPRMYFINRRLRDLEKQSAPLGQFALSLRKELSGATLRTVQKDTRDRIVRFHFVGTNELGREKRRTLIAQLTGRSANLFLLDDKEMITHQARPIRVRTASGSGRLISGQQIGEAYCTPSATKEPPPSESETILFETIQSGKSSASEAADAYFTSLLSEQTFDTKASAARSNLRKKISRQQKLLQELQKDLATHADAEQH